MMSYHQLKELNLNVLKELNNTTVTLQCSNFSTNLYAGYKGELQQVHTGPIGLLIFGPCVQTQLANSNKKES